MVARSIGGEAKLRAGEVEMARKLVGQLSAKEFHPERHEDESRDRLQEVVRREVEGHEVTATAPEKPRAQVIDLMHALKARLAHRGVRTGGRPPGVASRRSR